MRTPVGSMKPSRFFAPLGASARGRQTRAPRLSPVSSERHAYSRETSMRHVCRLRRRSKQHRPFISAAMKRPRAGCLVLQPLAWSRQSYFLSEALSLGSELAMRPLVAHCHLGLGKLYRRTGKRQEAREQLATATTMYREMGMMYWLEQAAEMRELS